LLLLELYLFAKSLNCVSVCRVSKSHSPVFASQRYTIAHELGHYLNGHEHYEKNFDNNEQPYFDHYYQQEREADIFAAELLMPKTFLKNDLDKYGLDISKLIEKYQVSEQALWIRLTSTGLAQKYQGR